MGADAAWVTEGLSTRGPEVALAVPFPRGTLARVLQTLGGISRPLFHPPPPTATWLPFDVSKQLVASAGRLSRAVTK